MSLFKRKFILKQSHADGAPNFVYTILQLPKRGVCSFASSTPSKPNTHYILKLSYWPKFKFRETPYGEFNILESQTSLIELIQVSRPQTYKKRTFRCVAHWHSYRMNYLLRSLKV